MKSTKLPVEPKRSPMPDVFPNRDAKIRRGVIRISDLLRNTAMQILVE